jgi:hypothetical protein
MYRSTALSAAGFGGACRRWRDSNSFQDLAFTSVQVYQIIDKTLLIGFVLQTISCYSFTLFLYYRVKCTLTGGGMISPLRCRWRRSSRSTVRSSCRSMVVS